MYFSRAMNRSMAPPDWLSINLTLKCNLACTMCTTCYDVPQELSTSEVLDLIDQAALWGIKIFNPLGGEPFMRPDLEVLLAHAARKDFHITLTTNGTLITARRAEQLAVIPPEKLHINLSLDGPEAVHDTIRGDGTYRRAMAGYRHLRAADLARGNPRRKILANTIIHRRNLDVLPAFLNTLAQADFSGVQLLNLFRQGPAYDNPGNSRPDLAADSHGTDAALWIRPEDLPDLERLVTQLRDRAKRPPNAPFHILNSDSDLALIPSYYRGTLDADDAPCWAGWKELYINADGQAIMCDGALEFLNGGFGSVRKQTLQQLWNSPELTARRSTVKACRTPCIQNCYLRRESDSITAIGAAAIETIGQRALRRLPTPKFTRPEHVRGGVFTLELCDVDDWASDQHAPPRLAALLSNTPETISACYADPRRWNQWRDEGYVDFGRGFMGFEVIRDLVSDLRHAGLSFDTVRLRWRGEPLLHPEIERVLPFLLAACGPDQPFRLVEIETHGLLLSDSLIEIAAASTAAQRWVFDIDRMGTHTDLGAERIAALVARREPGLEIHLACTVAQDSHPVSDRDRWQRVLPDAAVVVGNPAQTGDAIWFRRTDPQSFLGDQAANAALVRCAESLGLSARLPDPTVPRQCSAASRTPTISWDAKLTLCRWDDGLAIQAGDVLERPFSTLWRGEPLTRHRRSAETRGVPDGSRCQDCHQPFSPNNP
jgi:MoaA/NifB/PqqE/SkfB family radical SAM enzyme